MPAPMSPVAGAIRLVAGTAAFAALLFVTAGTAAWPAAWAYLVTISAVMAVYAVIIARLHPELIEERRNPPADAKSWDKPFVVIVGMVGPVVFLVLAGLDHRFGWSRPTASWVQVLGILAVAAG